MPRINFIECILETHHLVLFSIPARKPPLDPVTASNRPGHSHQQGETSVLRRLPLRDCGNVTCKSFQSDQTSALQPRASRCTHRTWTAQSS